jgi:dTDP-4-amino-4,6-dideoxygalactose transaminase
MIYYPLPLYRQASFSKYVPEAFTLPVTEKLCKSVLSLHIHTEMTEEILAHITKAVIGFRP